MNRAIREEKMGASGMEAPEVKSIALIHGAAGGKRIWAYWAILAISANIYFLDTQDHVA